MVVGIQTDGGAGVPVPVPAVGAEVASEAMADIVVVLPLPRPDTACLLDDVALLRVLDGAVARRRGSCELPPVTCLRVPVHYMLRKKRF